MTYANGTADPVGLDATRFETRIGHEGYVRRLPERVTRTITASKLEVTDRFREVVDLFGEDHQETPAGFRIEMATHGSVTSVDLVRDIGYERGGTPRPTPRSIGSDCNPQSAVLGVAIIGVLKNVDQATAPAVAASAATKTKGNTHDRDQQRLLRGPNSMTDATHRCRDRCSEHDPGVRMIRTMLS